MVSFMKPSTDWMLFNSFQTIFSIVKIYWPYKAVLTAVIFVLLPTRTVVWKSSKMHIIVKIYLPPDVDINNIILTENMSFWKTLKKISFSPVVLQPNAGQDLPILEISRSQNVALQSVEHPWTSDQIIAETSTWQHTTLTRNKHPCLRRDSNSQSQQASQP